MPNWAFNEVVITGPDTNKAVDLLVRDEQDEPVVDFNLLVPMPKELNISCGSSSSDAIAVAVLRGDLPESAMDFGYGRVKDIEDVATRPLEDVLKELLIQGEDYETGKEMNPVDYYNRVVSNIRKYGVVSWYDWCNEHWGTKWNACHCECNDYGTQIELRFDTAWCEPIPVIDALRAKVVELGLDVEIEWRATYEMDDDISVYEIRGKRAA